jgi:hypothetical protein
MVCVPILCRSIETGDICRLGRANGESKDSVALKPRGVHWPGARHIGALATQTLTLFKLFDSCYFPQLPHFHVHPNFSSEQLSHFPYVIKQFW